MTEVRVYCFERPDTNRNLATYNDGLFYFIYPLITNLNDMPAGSAQGPRQHFKRAESVVDFARHLDVLFSKKKVKKFTIGNKIYSLEFFKCNNRLPTYYFTGISIFCNHILYSAVE